MQSTKIKVIVKSFNAELLEESLAVTIGDIISKRIESDSDFPGDKVKVYDRILNILIKEEEHIS